MEIKGTVKQIMPVQTGKGAKGDWQKQELLLTYGDKYPKTVQVTCMGKVVDTIEQLSEGMEVTAHINPESREYNGKYYSSINAWKLEFVGVKTPMAKTPVNAVDDSEDLPF